MYESKTLRLQTECESFIRTHCAVDSEAIHTIDCRKSASELLNCRWKMIEPSKLAEESVPQLALNETKNSDNLPTENHLPVPTMAESSNNDSIASADLSGTQLANYGILRIIGRGGMGTVYEAEDLNLKRRVALKTMLPHIASSELNRTRFLREAQTAARVEHDHICPIYQVGEANGVPFIAMPYLLGESLGSLLQKGRMVPVSAVGIAIQTAHGLSEAHQAGLVHRDIKPANIWMEQKTNGRSRVRILDFGLAHVSDNEVQLTRTGMILGTPAYMAPEQARGEKTDSRADLFSLGVVLYEMLTGKRAFSGSNTVSILTSLSVDDPVSPIELNPQVSTQLSELVMKLLEKNPDQRLGPAATVVDELLIVRRQLKATSTGESTIESKAKNLPFSIPESGPKVINTLKPNIGSINQHPTNQGFGKFTGRWIAALIALAMIGGGIFSSIILLQTNDGTLLVEVEEDADVRFKDGHLHVFDESGELKYTISPSETNRDLPPGKYTVKVVGADGVKLNTDKFELTKLGKVTLRVTSQAQQNFANANEEVDSNEVDPPRDFFPGRLIVLEDFRSEETCTLPLGDSESERRFLENKHYVYRRVGKGLGGPHLIEIGNPFTSGANVVRCRAINGDLFLNFGVQRNSKHGHWMCLTLQNGSWRLEIKHREFIGGKWLDRESKTIASNNETDVRLINGKWVELAVRWTLKDYDLWLNGVHISGGENPIGRWEDGKPSKPTQIGIVVTNAEIGLELDYIGAWDQSDIEISEAAPTSLPGRPELDSRPSQDATSDSTNSNQSPPVVVQRP